MRKYILLASFVTVFCVFSWVTFAEIVGSTESAINIYLDKSTSFSKVAESGKSDQTVLILQVIASNEPIDLKQISLVLRDKTSQLKVTRVTLWDGSKMVGEGKFTYYDYKTNFPLYNSFVIPKNGSKSLIVKADIAELGSGKPNTSGNLIKIDYDASGREQTYGMGTVSGKKIISSSMQSTESPGVAVFKTFPVFAKIPLVSNYFSSSTSTRELYKFSVSSKSGGSVSFNKLSINIATTSVVLKNLKVNAYMNKDLSVTIPKFLYGQVASTINQPQNGTNAINFSNTVQIPSGQTYYFVVSGNLTSTLGAITPSISLFLEGDTGFPQNYPGTLEEIKSDAKNLLIWSPNSGGYASNSTNKDWFNGHKLLGDKINNVEKQLLTYSALAATTKTATTTTKLKEECVAAENTRKTVSATTPYVFLVSPKKCDRWAMKNTYDIKWESRGVNKITISLLKGGLKIRTIASNIAATSTVYSWKVPETLNESGSYYIKITTDKSGVTYTTPLFSIVEINLKVTSPNGYENWKAGEIQPIRWKADGISKFTIELRDNVGVLRTIAKNYEWIAASSTDFGILPGSSEKAYSWKIPNDITQGSSYKISVRSSSGFSIADVSDNFFSIFSESQD